MKTTCLLLLLLLAVPASHAQYTESDWDDRDQWMDVQQILNWAELGPGDAVADIGCHEGYLSMHLANRVGDGGRVFAVDIDEDRINTLSRHARARNLKNITVVLGDDDNPRLPPRSLDVAIIMDTYHEIHEYMEVLEHVRQALKPGGRIVILEKLKAHAIGKSRDEQIRSHTLSPHYVKAELKEAGFVVVSEYPDLGKWEREEDKTIWLIIGKVPQV